MSLGLSAFYLASLEGFTMYQKQMNVYSNWWINNTLSAYCSYKMLYF